MFRALSPFRNFVIVDLHAHWAAIRNQDCFPLASLFLLIRADRILPLLPLQLAEVLEVTLRHLRLILSAKDSDLKSFDIALALSRLHTRGFEVLKVLIDNFIGINVTGNFVPRLLIRNEL